MLSFPTISVKVMKNTEGSSAATRMDLDLEISILSEISQRHIHQSLVRGISKKEKIQGAQGRCTGMTLREGMEREVGGGFRMGEHMYTRGWFMSMYGKNHYNIVIILQLK